MLRNLWEKFKALAHALGNFEARVILTLFYGLFVVPTGMVVRLFTDPLELHPTDQSSYWHSRAPEEVGLDAARRQF